MNKRDVGIVVCAVLVGASIALPLGVMLGAGKTDTSTAPPYGGSPKTGATTRAIYSPKVLSDPAFLAQQRRGVAALEEHCHATGKMCVEARAARKWLTKNDDSTQP